MQIFCYLDDWLIVANGPQLLISDRDRTLELVQSLGFIVKGKKSSLVTTQYPKFWGAEIDLPGLRARPSAQRLGTILVATRAHGLGGLPQPGFGYNSWVHGEFSGRLTGLSTAHVATTNSLSPALPPGRGPVITVSPSGRASAPPLD